MLQFSDSRRFISIAYEYIRLNYMNPDLSMYTNTTSRCFSRTFLMDDYILDNNGCPYKTHIAMIHTKSFKVIMNMVIHLIH